jgi:hypothetical protein
MATVGSSSELCSQLRRVMPSAGSQEALYLVVTGVEEGEVCSGRRQGVDLKLLPRTIRSNGERKGMKVESATWGWPWRGGREWR